MVVQYSSTENSCREQNGTRVLIRRRTMTTEYLNIHCPSISPKPKNVAHTHRVISHKMTKLKVVALFSMTLLCFLLTAVTCQPLRLRFNSNSKRNLHIAGGTLASENEFPFLVSFQMVDATATSTTHFCGGSIIAPNVILSAGM